MVRAGGRLIDGSFSRRLLKLTVDGDLFGLIDGVIARRYFLICDLQKYLLLSLVLW